MKIRVSELVDRWIALLFVALWFAAFPCSAMAARAADDSRRPWDGSPGFCRISSTVSPDGRYVVIWAPAKLSPEARAALAEWAPDLDINCEKTEIDDFLYDNTRKCVAVELPEFDYFEGQGWKKNRSAMYVAWTPDSRNVLIISEERWDDQGVVWVDAGSGRVTDLKDVLEKACIRVLPKRERKPDSVMIQFSDPVILPGNLLVIDANAGHMKQGPYYHHRLTFRFALSGGCPHLEFVKARAIPESEEHNSGADYDPDLNVCYKRLRAKLDDNAKAALKKEEEAWIKLRDAQPALWRDELTRRRAAELRARLEN